MSGYSDPVAGAVPRPLRAADIDRLFKRARGWFSRDRTRKRLYAKGFPHPLERGRWSAALVAHWMATTGANQDAVPPATTRRTAKARRRRPAGANGYAQVGR